jgi:hypothetical protein
MIRGNSEIGSSDARMTGKIFCVFGCFLACFSFRESLPPLGLFQRVFKAWLEVAGAVWVMVWATFSSFIWLAL